MLNRFKFAGVVVLLLILSAAVRGQTVPGNTDVNAGDPPAAVSTDAAEIPATPAEGLKVQFDAPILKISARQIKLGDLLAAITEKTGVPFDLPDSLSDRMVSAETGPAVLRAALTELLKKLELGYGISGDPAQPETVERVVLTGVTDTAPLSADGSENASTAKTPDEQTDDGMTAFEVEEMLEQKAIQQNLAIEKNLAEAEAERQAQIAKEDFGGKPPEPDKAVAPAAKRPRKKPAAPQPE